jgi:hypothetical protein
VNSKYIDLNRPQFSDAWQRVRCHRVRVYVILGVLVFLAVMALK